MVWRVVRMRDNDGHSFLALCDVVSNYRELSQDRSPFTLHDPAYPIARTLDGIREALDSMKAALDKPIMQYEEDRWSLKEPD